LPKIQNLLQPWGVRAENPSSFDLRQKPLPFKREILICGCKNFDFYYNHWPCRPINNLQLSIYRGQNPLLRGVSGHSHDGVCIDGGTHLPLTESGYSADASGQHRKLSRGDTSCRKTLNFITTVGRAAQLTIYNYQLTGGDWYLSI
jgi:hypothetical protein